MPKDFPLPAFTDIERPRSYFDTIFNPMRGPVRFHWRPANPPPAEVDPTTVRLERRFIICDEAAKNDPTHFEAATRILQESLDAKINRAIFGGWTPASKDPDFTVTYVDDPTEITEIDYLAITRDVCRS